MRRTERMRCVPFGCLRKGREIGGKGPRGSESLGGHTIWAGEFGVLSLLAS